MVDPTLGYELGKNHIDMVKIQMETEQNNLAEMVKFELEEAGFPCKIIEDGTQRMRAGIFPVKIPKLKIVPTKKLNDNEDKEFQKLKLKFTKEYAKIRQEQMKDEMNRLKKEKKNKT